MKKKPNNLIFNTQGSNAILYISKHTPDRTKRFLISGSEKRSRLKFVPATQRQETYDRDVQSCIDCNMYQTQPRVLEDGSAVF